MRATWSVPLMDGDGSMAKEILSFPRSMRHRVFMRASKLAFACVRFLIFESRQSARRQQDREKDGKGSRRGRRRGSANERAVPRSLAVLAPVCVPFGAGALFVHTSIRRRTDLHLGAAFRSDFRERRRTSKNTFSEAPDTSHGPKRCMTNFHKRSNGGAAERRRNPQFSP